MVDDEIFGIALELLVPSVLAVLVQWGLVRRRHLQMAGEDDLTLWPWVTTGSRGFVILNPYGLAFLQATLKRTAGDLMWQFIVQVTVGVACGLIVMAGIECYIREAPDAPPKRRSGTCRSSARRTLSSLSCEL